MPPSLSIVIPTYRDRHCLALTLESLRRQRLPAHRFEVIVVADGGPLDESTTKAIDSLGYRRVELSEHVGRAGARNRGIDEARGNVLVFLDGDSFAAPDLLERHDAFHAADPVSRVLLGTRWEMGWAALDTILAGGTPDPAALSAEEADLRFPPWITPEQQRELMQTPWLFAYTNNVSIRRDLVESIGRFDERFGTRWGFEDLDLFYRAYEALGRPENGFVHDGLAYCFHLPHFRTRRGIYEDYLVNMNLAKAKHASYEWEFTGLMEPAAAAARIRRYREAVRASAGLEPCRAGRVWRRCHDLLGVDGAARMLVVGLGTDALALTPETRTLDASRPRTERNLPLLGCATPYEAGDVDVVVNLNLWRWLGVHDLSRYIEESLRIGEVSVLVHSADFAMPPGLAGISDVEYVVQMVHPYVDTTVSHRGPDTVVTLRRAAAAP